MVTIFFKNKSSFPHFEKRDQDTILPWFKLLETDRMRPSHQHL